MPTRLSFDPCPPGFSDHVYKTAHGVDIPLRIWPAKESSSDKPAPWFLWIHGGGYQGGNHYAPNPWVNVAFENYNIVSVAYRFIPEVVFSEQVQDIVDAFHWCQANLASVVPNVDLGAWAVGGDSAGGTLSMLLAHQSIDPLPRAVANLYGPTFMLADDFLKPASRYKIDLTPEREEEVKAALAIRDPAKARVVQPWDWEIPPQLSVEVLRSYWGVPDYTPGHEDYLQIDAYLYVGLKGTRLQLAFRQDECDGEEFKRRAIQGSSLSLLDGKQSYPPTYILHGTGDIIVPVSQGEKFEAKLKEMGVPVESNYPEGEGHAFDQRISDRNDPDWDRIIQPMFDFVDKHVRA